MAVELCYAMRCLTGEKVWIWQFSRNNFEFHFFSNFVQGFGDAGRPVKREMMTSRWESCFMKDGDASSTGKYRNLDFSNYVVWGDTLLYLLLFRREIWKQLHFCKYECQARPPRDLRDDRVVQPSVCFLRRFSIPDTLAADPQRDLPRDHQKPEMSSTQCVCFSNPFCPDF